VSEAIAARPERLSAQSVMAGLLYAGTALLILAPLGYILFGSFLTASPSAPTARFTVANWLQVYGTSEYRRAFFNTLLLSFVVAAASLVVGGLMAWIVARTNAPGRNQLAVLIAVPLMLSNLITTLAWIALAAPNAGFINAAAKALFGIKVLFNAYSFAGIVLVMVSHFAAFAFISLLAVFASINGSLEEASYMLGAGALQTGWRMTLPLIWPTMVSTSLLIFVLCAENFSVPSLLGSPIGFDTLPSRIFIDMTVEPAQPTVAAAAGTMLLWIALLGTAWQRRILKHASRYVTISGKGNRARQTDLGKLRFLATAILALFVFVAVILPYAALVFSSFLNFLTPHLHLSLFTLGNYTAMLQPNNFAAGIHSLEYSLLGGLAITLLYLILSYFIRQSRGRFAVFMDYLVIIPTTVPALVLAIGILWTFVGIPLPIYGTFAILCLAYYIRFIGLGVRQSRAALVQISGDLAEAARIAGASPLRGFRDITLPLLKPALMSLWTILFMSIFTEISITILLYSTDTVTLPVALWNDMAAGYQTNAFAIAVVQATAIFLLIVFAHRRFGILRTTLES
jgi:iron(III) transport system permease protein